MTKRKEAPETATASAEKKHSNLKPFQPGQSGNPGGRQKGSRNKLGEAFIAALHDDFIAHGVSAIEQTRTENPAAYLKVVASLMPQQIEIKESAFDGLPDDELAALIAAARDALGVSDEPGERAPAPSRTH